MDKRDKVSVEELRELLKDLTKSQQKTEVALQQVAEAQRKTEATLEESQRKTEESLRKLSITVDKTNGNFNNKWGQLVENIVKGDLLELLRTRGIDAEKVQPRMVYADSAKKIRGEIDLLVINGEEMVAIEVKTTLSKKNIDDFIEKVLFQFKRYFPEHAHKKIYGGVAFLDTTGGVEEYANEAGLFVIRAGGGEAQVSVILNDADFKPREF